jgi:DNA processing protein
LRLSLVTGVGPRIYGDLVEHFGSAELALDASPAELRSIQGVGQKLMRALVSANEDIDVEPVLQQCRDDNIHVIDRAHENYPPLLKKIYDPPGVLFCKGEFQPVDQLAIAIVGTRHSTNYGDRVAANLARGLSMAGLTIISGMARGIDAAAHKAALECGGRTIAVLGGGVMNIYPPEHKSLADSIAAKGAVLSEALPNQAPRSGCFPRRNRIVTGMSLGVIVVEAGDRSGASISARLAAEQGRDVFAVPGRIDSRMSRGCHKLIRDGATLVETVDDVLDQLGPLVEPLKLSGAKVAGEQTQTVRHPAELKLSDQERKVLNCIETSPTEFDLIVEKTQLPPARILATVSVLEIRRLIRRLSSTSFVRL